jgi:hypothetical protein
MSRRRYSADVQPGAEDPRRDGMHRIVRALLDGRESIKARRFEEQPARLSGLGPEGGYGEEVSGFDGLSEEPLERGPFGLGEPGEGGCVLDHAGEERTAEGFTVGGELEETDPSVVGVDLAFEESSGFELVGDIGDAGSVQFQAGCQVALRARFVEVTQRRGLGWGEVEFSYDVEHVLAQALDETEQQPTEL